METKHGNMSLHTHKESTPTNNAHTIPPWAKGQYVGHTLGSDEKINKDLYEKDTTYSKYNKQRKSE